MNHQLGASADDSPKRINRRAIVTATAAAGAVFAASTRPAAAEPAKPSSRRWNYVDVRSHGARGDGVADDTDAIQRAIDAAFEAGGGTVVLPAGTYLVSPSLNVRHIRLRSGVNLMGEGDSSVIKVKDDAGDYWVLIGGFWGDDLVENVRISDLRIDQNPSGNTTCNIDLSRQDTSWFYQFAIGLFNYRNIVVENVTFDPICGVNTVVLNNYNCSDALVRNCHFRFELTRSLNPLNYDNSAIYLNGRRHVIEGNRFEAEISQLARGAIETHTGSSVVSGNVSIGYQTGCNAQASEKSGERSDMTVSGNTFSNCRSGIILWNKGEHSLHNVTVEGNTISLSNPEHNAYLSWGIGSTNAAAWSGTFENIGIHGNTIIFDEELETRESLNEAYTYGIGIVKENAVISRVSITGNIIKNCPLAGIRFGGGGDQGRVTDVVITDNVLVDCGHYPAEDDRYKSGILLESKITGGLVADNYIADNYDAPKISSAIRAQDGTYSGVVVRANHSRGAGGPLPDELADSLRPPVLSDTSGASLGEVESQLNLVKEALRAYGVAAAS